jgi:hypothetical protein
MLRNLAATNSNGSGILGTYKVGVRASEMPTGFPLPGLLNNDVAAGDPADCLYRVEIQYPVLNSAGQPAANANLYVYEDGGFSFVPGADGTFTVGEKISKYSATTGLIETGNATLNLLIGVPTVSSVAVSPSAVTVSGGGVQAFSAVVSGQNAPSQAVTWSASAGTINASGAFTAPAATTSQQTITITATSQADPTKSGTATVTINASAPAGNPPTVTSVAVSPSTVTLAGGAAQAFSAVVNGQNSPSQVVTWSCTAGSIDGSGSFTAPAATTSAQTITVTATSQADPSRSGTATVTIAAVSSTVTSVTVSPATASIGGGAAQAFTASVAGTFGPSQAVAWSTNLGQIDAAGNYTAPLGIATTQSATITATSKQDATKSGTATVTIGAATVSAVSVSPGAITVESFARVTFRPTVNGTGNPSQAVSWASDFGQIDAAGVLTAPLAVGSNRTVTVTATSLIDGSKAGTATVTVTALLAGLTGFMRHGIGGRRGR